MILLSQYEVDTNNSGWDQKPMHCGVDPTNQNHMEIYFGPTITWKKRPKLDFKKSCAEQEISQGFYLLLKTIKCKLEDAHDTVVTNDFSAYRPFRSSYAVLDQRTRPVGGGKITSMDITWQGKIFF